MRKLVKADKNGVYSFGFYEKDSLPGDCHATLAMTQYFVRNGTVFCLLKSNSTFNIRSLCYSVQRTFCHCEERSDVAISRKGNRIVMTECVARMAKTTLKSCAFFGDDVFTAQVNFVIYFTIFLRLSLVIKINRFLLRVKIGGKSPLFFGNAVRISPF